MNNRILHSFLGAWLSLAGFTCQAFAVTDPTLNLTITRTNQSVVMSWFGSNTMAYQVEASSNLTVWSGASPILPGNGGVLFHTNLIAGPDREFFRVRRIPDTTSAVFNPQTGVLTITGDTLPNIIVVSRDLAGNLRVNNGTVAITVARPRWPTRH